MTDRNAAEPAETDEATAVPGTTPLPACVESSRSWETAIGLDVRDPAVGPPHSTTPSAISGTWTVASARNKPDSEVSRLIRGELEETDASSDLAARFCPCRPGAADE